MEYNHQLIVRRQYILVQHPCFYWLWTLSLTYDLEFQSPASYGHDPYTCKYVSHRSVDSNTRVETDVQTDRWLKTLLFSLTLPVTPQICENYWRVVVKSSQHQSEKCQSLFCFLWTSLVLCFHLGGVTRYVFALCVCVCVCLGRGILWLVVNFQPVSGYCPVSSS